MKDIRHSSKILVLFLLLIMVALPTAARAAGQAETINSYHSDIVIHRDSTMQVTETINVTCANVSILHGIYRDFPTSYKDSRGNNVKVGFEVVEVQRDGKPEKFSVSGMSNGKRVRIGDKDVYLSPGKYTYKIVYNTYRQLGYFEDHDELFWNVTGNGWMFPILRASATITLPEELKKGTTKLGGYTGVMGSTEKSLDSYVTVDGKAAFSSMRVLSQGEGLSIFVTFPKGIVEQPGTVTRAFYWIRDNFFACFMMLGAVFSLFIYLYGWLRHGIDPKKGTIIPLYTPPRELPPADMRYIRRMGFDNKALTASIINMAVKGYLTINDQDGKSSYVLTKTGSNQQRLSELEGSIAELLPSQLALKKKYNPIMTQLVKQMTTGLHNAYSKRYFIWNAKYVALSMLVTIVTFIISFVFLEQSISAVAILPVALIIVPHLFFWWLLKAPTKEGRKVMDEIEGFRRFLTVTEKDRLNLLNPPDQTPELFEKYLPYALALDVDQQWSEQFSAMFHGMAAEGRSYSPMWYSGAAWNMHHTSGFAHSLNSSFSTVISSASTPPGSSGGSGGGSGGGGGGGGGGGW